MVLWLSDKPKELVYSSHSLRGLSFPLQGLQDALHRPRVTDGRTLSGYLLISLLPGYLVMLGKVNVDKGASIP